MDFVDALETDVVLVLRSLHPKSGFSNLPKQLCTTTSTLVLWQLFLAIHAYDYKMCKAIAICLHTLATTANLTSQMQFMLVDVSCSHWYRNPISLLPTYSSS
jgi:hypothetical protein